MSSWPSQPRTPSWRSGRIPIISRFRRSLSPQRCSPHRYGCSCSSLGRAQQRGVRRGVRWPPSASRPSFRPRSPQTRASSPCATCCATRDTRRRPTTSSCAISRQQGRRAPMRCSMWTLASGAWSPRSSGAASGLPSAGIPGRVAQPWASRATPPRPACRCAAATGSAGRAFAYVCASRWRPSRTSLWRSWRRTFTGRYLRRTLSSASSSTSATCASSHDRRSPRALTSCVSYARTIHSVRRRSTSCCCRRLRAGWSTRSVRSSTLAPPRRSSFTMRQSMVPSSPS